MKHVKLPVYNGQGQNFCTWVRKVRETLLLTQTDPINWSSVTRLSLEGAAADYIQNNDPHLQWSFEELLAYLAEEFEIMDDALTTMVFFDTMQREKETVAGFLRRLESTYCRCFPHEVVNGRRYDSDMRSQILRGLRMDVKQKCATALTERTYASIKEKLRTIEVVLDIVNEGKTPRRNISSETARPPGAVKPILKGKGPNRVGWASTVHGISHEDAVALVRAETSTVQNGLENTMEEVSSKLETIADRLDNRQSDFKQRPRSPFRDRNSRTIPSQEILEPAIIADRKGISNVNAQTLYSLPPWKSW
jgi:hypothetical protein